jgi:hypothetical protein
MREETVVKYIADDGVIFKDRIDCLHYEKLCEKYKTWLRLGKVMFWGHAENYLNFELCERTSADNDNTSYLDWLKKRLSTAVSYIKINEHPCGDDWAPVWEFVVKYCLFDTATTKKIESTYCEGDLLSYDPSDCRFHNIDLVMRNATAAKERLDKDIVRVCKERNWEV